MRNRDRAPSQVKGDGAPVSAQQPCIGFRRVIVEPIVWTMRQPPKTVPSTIAEWQASTTQNGTWKPLPGCP